MKYLKYIIPSAIIAFGAIFFGFNYQTARANPTFFSPAVRTANASTTVNYLIGTANTQSGTTTLVYDSYGTSTLTQASGATLLVQAIGSSTNATINIDFEFATGYAAGSDVNCVTTPTACDWYSNNLINSVSSTTIYQSMPSSIAWTLASSTIARGAISGSATVAGTSTRAFFVPTPVRYTRVVFSSKLVASGGSAFWAELVPSKERSE